jgi:SAM-dependent methyltransferase
MTINWNLERHNSMFKDKNVLDLGCHTGDSSRKIASFGAKSVTGIEIRQSSLDLAVQETTSSNINYFCEDITNYNFINPLVAQSEVVACFGVFYHLFDHFRFLSCILKPNIEYVLLETLQGPDSPDPGMFWSFEPTDSEWNGWFNNLTEIPAGSPNISWITQSAKLFGFEVDFLEYYYGFGVDTNRRMIVRLYNSKIFPEKQSLLLNC